MPRSTLRNRKAMFLRPGDQVSFRDHDTTVHVQYHADATNEPLVEVKFSEPVKRKDIWGNDVEESLENDSLFKQADETDDDDDGDLDIKPSAKAVLTTETGIVEQSVNCPPKSPSTPGEPFSTARTAPQVVQETPTVQRNRATASESQKSQDQPIKQLNFTPVDFVSLAQIEGEDHAAVTGTEDSPMDEATTIHKKRKTLHDSMSSHLQKSNATRPQTDGGTETPPQASADLPDSSKSFTESLGKKRLAHNLDVEQETPSVTQESNPNKRVKSSQTSSASTRAKRPGSAATPSATSAVNTASPIEQAEDGSVDRYSGEAPRILFSNTEVDTRPGLMRFLREQKASKSNSSSDDDSNFLCIGQGELKTTAKLLMSLVLNKDIVTDKWVTDSSKKGYLLKTKDYLPTSLFATKYLDRSGLFKDKVVYFTQAVKKLYGRGFADIQSVLKHAGVQEVAVKSAREITDDLDPLSTIIVGLETKDNDVPILLGKHTVFKKEFISASIMEAQLLVKNEDLMINPGITDKNEQSNMGKKRKAG